MDAAAARHPDVPYEPQLIDATFALLLAQTGAPLVIPALNRDGDILSDLVLPLFGSIAGSESMLVAFDEEYVPRALMAEAAHGTAPSLFGKDVANPMAMILAGAALLTHADEAASGRRPCDPRGDARNGCRRDSYGRSRRPRGLAGVHRRGDPPHEAEARSLVARSSRSSPDLLLRLRCARHDAGARRSRPAASRRRMPAPAPGRTAIRRTARARRAPARP